MAKKFFAQVDQMVSRNERILDAVAKESFQTVVDISQTPVAKGGNMRVDTGFLRASGQASLDGMPTGPARPADGMGGGDADVTLTVAKLQLGDTFYFGWTANYARPREYIDGFLRLATQRWQSIVSGVVARAKARIR